MAEADVDDGYGYETDPPNVEFSAADLEIPETKYEYLDHPADVQLHAWGDTLEEAFEQIAVSMFGYMTEIDKVEILLTQDIEAEGHDMLSLLFHFLDEFLYLFSAEPYFIARKVKILSFDRENFKIKARGYGEVFDLDKHPQPGEEFPCNLLLSNRNEYMEHLVDLILGTEVKAITYSNMQVHENPDKSELFVIIDI